MGFLWSWLALHKDPDSALPAAKLSLIDRVRLGRPCSASRRHGALLSGENTGFFPPHPAKLLTDHETRILPHARIVCLTRRLFL